MFLTRFAMNRQRRGARELLASPFKMHAAIESGFPPAAGPAVAQSPGRVLWRIDPTERATLLYVSSPTPPDFSHLVDQAGWPASGQSWETRDLTPLLDLLEKGQIWRFRLTANPTRRVLEDKAKKLGADGEGRNVVGKRMAHLTAQQQQDWLLSKTQGLGFSIPDDDGEPQLMVTSRARLRFEHGKGRPVTLTAVGYEGVLAVDDPQALRQALIGGIGAGKAFGCGLMTLAKPPG
ncbi:MAG: type I-E CRISPR-associated protein Cas6/Cse3/CasE [Bifidobacteriaceae bacterium]|jgi:CRISPR system Cascade subunit CasE|nr:type I-E CRISPR-associated protein Cas6/Cse3/CasE [Bifidobacteriaceae bacterium]